MKIVILDGYTLNPGDLDWGELEALGECQIFDRTPPALVVQRAIDADILLTNKTPVSFVKTYFDKSDYLSGWNLLGTYAYDKKKKLSEQVFHPELEHTLQE